MEKKKKFSDRVREQLQNKSSKTIQHKTLGFECLNCLNSFEVTIVDVYFDKARELHFTPEPTCPRCGATQEIQFSEATAEIIDHLIWGGKIRTEK